MIIYEALDGGFVRLHSDAGRAVIDTRSGNGYSEVVTRATAAAVFVEGGAQGENSPAGNTSEEA